MTGIQTNSLRDKRILVTGAARGLGRAITEHLLSEGAKVYATDVLTSELHDAYASQDEDRLRTGSCDVTDVDEVVESVDDAATQWGGLDAVVNNAALVAVTRAPADEVPVDEFDRVMAVNVRGPWLIYRAALRHLAVRGGSVVNMSSETAVSGSRHLSHYVTSKAAVAGLTRALAKEGGAAGIRVNAVAPGFTDTEGARGIGDPDTYDTSPTPLGRVGLPGDVVGAVAFLLSDASAFVSGQVLLVNGGRVCG